MIFSEIARLAGGSGGKENGINHPEDNLSHLAELGIGSSNRFMMELNDVQEFIVGVGLNLR